MSPTQNRPFRPGTVIECAGVQGTVTKDAGSGLLDVDCAGFVQQWEWSGDDGHCKIISTPRGRLFYESFDDYAADFPEGEHLRPWLTNMGHQQAHLLRLTDPPHRGSPHGGLIGNFMAVSLTEDRTGPYLAAHDCDDGLMVRAFAPGQRALAEQVLADMKALAPFSMWEAAEMFEFSWS